MSLASSLRPVGSPFTTISASLHSGSSDRPSSVSFEHTPQYLALSRMLTRFQNLILYVPPPDASPDAVLALSPLQRRIRAELWARLPLHRNKWSHNIDGARNLLLQLERTAQAIKAPAAKRDALKELSHKRTLIKKLRNRVEEIGREVESSEDWADGLAHAKNDDEVLGEPIERIIGKPLTTTRGRSSPDDGDLQEGKPVDTIVDGPDQDIKNRQELFNESSTRRRQGQGAVDDTRAAENTGKTSGFSNLQETEKQLQASDRTNEDLTTSLVSMAVQLKQQSRAFQFALDQDKGLLDQALEGLDKNLSGMEAASRNMAFLKRMSEGEGWWGRIKLYAMIFGMWVAAFLLVFVMPKLRF